ncbi:MAG TPA: carbohydrate kinase family protein [Mycobacteriales bacterium]|nr:carbohydrate kinase family protein [Mycobacteriales bacterium]
MKLVVTGSIATDHLMHFPGKFADQLLSEQLHKVSLSFLVDELVVRRGGVAGNIAAGMGKLGQHPVLAGAVGTDFDDYRASLQADGVDCESVYVSQTAHTARFVCTTDEELNQIGSFYTGAMAEARNIELAPIAERLGGLGADDIVLVSANDPDAMLRHSAECRERGYAFAADPSQQLARMDGDVVRQLIHGAAYLLTNDYENSLLASKTGLSDAEILDQVGVRITTLGSKGARIEGRFNGAGIETIQVDAAKEQAKHDPTGVGDGFRAGFFSGLAWGLSLERAAQVGNLVAAHVLESVGGPQDYDVKPAAFLERLADCYGTVAADEVATHLPA